MGSIHGNSMQPNEQHKQKHPVDLFTENGLGIPRGICFGSPDAGEFFWYAPDAGSADILENLKTRKLLFRQENVFLQK